MLLEKSCRCKEFKQELWRKTNSWIFQILLETFVERNIGTFNETVWVYMRVPAVWDDGRLLPPQQRKMQEQTLSVTHPLSWQCPRLPITSVWLVTCKTNLLIFHDCQNPFSATVSVISYALLVLEACVSVTLIKSLVVFFFLISTNMLASQHYNANEGPQYWSNPHWWPLQTHYSRK